MMNCNEENNFRLSDGKVIRNLVDLHKSFELMQDKVFKQHVRGKRNDFSVWVNDILNEKKLAEDLSSTKDKKVMELLIRKKIAGEFIRTIFYRL